MHNENVLPNLFESGFSKNKSKYLSKREYSDVYDINFLRLRFVSHNFEISQIKLPKAVNSVVKAIINVSS